MLFDWRRETLWVSLKKAMIWLEIWRNLMHRKPSPYLFGHCFVGLNYSCTGLEGDVWEGGCSWRQLNSRQLRVRFVSPSVCISRSGILMHMMTTRISSSFWRELLGGFRILGSLLGFWRAMRWQSGRSLTLMFTKWIARGNQSIFKFSQLLISGCGGLMGNSVCVSVWLETESEVADYITKVNTHVCLVPLLLVGKSTV